MEIGMKMEKREIKTYCKFHLGDNLTHLHFLRALVRKYSNISFLHALKEEYIEQCQELIDDINSIKLVSIENFSFENSFDAWKGSDNFYYNSPHKFQFGQVYISFFQYLSRKMGLESPFSSTMQLLFDYPAITAPNKYEKYNFLIVNSEALSGQFADYSELAFKRIADAISDKGFSIITTKKIGGYPCTFDMGLSVTAIAQLSLKCDYIIAVCTGAMWPSINIHNDVSTNNIFILNGYETVDFGKNITTCRTMRDLESKLNVCIGIEFKEDDSSEICSNLIEKNTSEKIDLTVIIPSRKQDKQIKFIRQAVNSVRKQSVAEMFNITFLVGVDKDCVLDQEVTDSLGVVCVESDGASQAAALNGAIRQLKSGFVAFLEDDDQWLPEYLQLAMQAIEHCDFVSSTQAEFDENDHLIRINDYPTPSGWFMTAKTLRNIGEFNEAYKFHLDNEWLGRLSEANLKRFHLVESTAPIEKAHMAQVRPWLANVLNLSSGLCKIARHQSPYPLVKRLVHSNSGMAKIASNKELSEISYQENQRLVNRFGRTPW